MICKLRKQSLNKQSCFEDIEEVLNKLTDDVCNVQEKQKNKFVKVINNQNICYIIINIVYHLFISLNIIKYRKIIKVKNIYCIIDGQKFKLNSKYVHIYDNCFEINKKIKIPYEYLKIIKKNNDTDIMIDLIPNERNITEIFFQTSNNYDMFNKISSNMNYHVRYHSVNTSAIKYYQNYNKTPLKVFI